MGVTLPLRLQSGPVITFYDKESTNTKHCLSVYLILKCNCFKPYIVVAEKKRNGVGNPSTDLNRLKEQKVVRRERQSTSYYVFRPGRFCWNFCVWLLWVPSCFLSCTHFNEFRLSLFRLIIARYTTLLLIYLGRQSAATRAFDFGVTLPWGYHSELKSNQKTRGSVLVL